MCVIWIFVECGVLVKKVRKKQLRETFLHFPLKTKTRPFSLSFFSLSFFSPLSFFFSFPFPHPFLSFTFPPIPFSLPFSFSSFPCLFPFPFLVPFLFFFTFLLFTSLSCHVLSFLKIKIKGNYISMQMWAMQHQCTSGRGWGL